MRALLTLLFCLCSALPSVVFGAVTINEVAWMGDTVSANHEWIELYNSGSAAVSLAGWTLTDGMNFTVELAGDIPPGTFALLERTSDESAPGAAFLVYTGALVNTGATLVLRDGVGGVMDQVAGGDNWQNIGGDNATKETAQYTSTGWVTDVPTPGFANRAGRSDTITDTKETDSPKTASSGSTNIVRSEASRTVLVRAGETELTLAIAGHHTVFVGQKVSFSVTARGVGTTIQNSLRYQWSFGDSYAATGTKVAHTFAYPGTYVVTVAGSYARHNSVARHEVTVLPVMLSLAQNDAGDVLLNNDAPYDSDVSGYQVVGTKTVVLPPHTILLPRATLTLAAARVGAGVAQTVVVRDTNGAVLATTDRVASLRDREETVARKSDETYSSSSAESLLIKTAEVAYAATDLETSQAPAIYHATGSVETQSDFLPALTSSEMVSNHSYALLFVLLLSVCVVILMSPKKTTVFPSPNQD